MPRVKGGLTSHHRHKKVLQQVKGQRAARSKHYKVAREALVHSLAFAYRHRRERKRDMRRLWIVRINAAARQQDLTYSQFIHGLQQAGVAVDRKVLAELAVNDQAAFKALADTAKQAL